MDSLTGAELELIGELLRNKQIDMMMNPDKSDSSKQALKFGQITVLERKITRMAKEATNGMA